MIGASKGLEGFMILIRRVAALPVTIALCLDHILLVHVVSLSNFLYLWFLVPAVRKDTVISKDIRAEYE